MRIDNATRAALLGISAAILLSGCATKAPPEGSGFLPDYERLEQVSAPDGGVRQVYANPRFTPANYSAVWLQPVTFHPQARPTDDVSKEALTQIRDAVNEALRQHFGQAVQLVDRAGPGVAVVRIAITTIGTEQRGLKPYQYIPVALVVTGARAAVDGGMPRDAAIAIETHVVDSISGETLYAAVRGGTGERVAHRDQGEGGVQLASLQPLIDEWASGAASEARKYIAGK